MTERHAPDLGVVAIGRNEGERLRRCLASIQGRAPVVVYVDSDSTDDSIALAESFGAHVERLDTSVPFSAGRARNEGLRRLLEIDPSLRYVQFVDGDCEIVHGWLEIARETLEGDPSLAVVCGRRRERFPERSVYNLLCDIEWDEELGEVDSCGGDSMMRIEAFLRAGRFGSLVAGEEPELCIRIRALGYRVVRLPEEMTLHDAAMERFSQWWKRSKRAGHAFAEIALMHGREEGRPGVRTTVSAAAYGGVLPVLGLLMPPLYGLYPLLFARIYRRQLALGRSPRQAGAYAAACTVGKFPEALGAARCWVGALTGRRSRIIEYK